MAQKARKLAWELIGVLVRYSDSEIADAAKLISSGSLFGPSSDLIMALASSAKDRRTIRPATNRPPQKHVKSKETLQVEMDRINTLIDAREVADHESLKDFARGIALGLYLKGTRALRDFSENLGVSLPKKLPTRAFVAYSLVEHLLALDVDARARLVSAARMDDRSSLKAWSDLIVR